MQGGMNLVASKPDSTTSRLAEAVTRRVGLRPADALRKVASSLAGVEEACRLAYVERMIAASSSDRDWIDFVERMLVHETYFFRHTAQVDLLRDDVLPRLDAQRRNEGRSVLTVWIAGCSTGEEAWTVAFLAREAHRARAFGEVVPVSILATDLSEAAVAAARQGIYDRLHGLDSFRAIPPWAAPYFSPGREDTRAWAVPETLRANVHFMRHNVLDPAPVFGADLVICRNLLIYFDDTANRRAQENLVSALRPGGVLVLGPADMPRTKGALDAIGTDSATVYLKKAVVP
jgi:chemotaxis protein methyltransferase CheR